MQSSENIFYVYEHWRLDKDEPFYVGKGKGGRAYDMKRRHPHHKAIMAKLERTGFAMEVRIVASNLSNDGATEIEIHQIATWRSYGIELVNKTDGGEGTTGLLHTEEFKKMISEVHKGKAKSLEHVEKVAKANTGKKRSQETCLKISIGKSNPSAETRMKLSIANSNPSAETRIKMGTGKSSIEVRQRMSEAQKKRFESEEERKKMSHPVSEETKKKMSRSALLRDDFSEEHRRKLSEAAKKQWERYRSKKETTK